MSESLILTDEDKDEKTEKDKKKSDKRSDSSAKIGASVLEKGPAPRAEQAKMSALDRIFASLLPEKEAKTKQNAKAEDILAELGKTKPEANTAETAEVLEPSRELRLSELNSGEVVIDLRAEDLEDDDGELAVTAQSNEDEASPGEAANEPEEPPQTTSTASAGRQASAGGSGGNRTPPPPRPTPSPPPPPRSTPSRGTPITPPLPIMNAPAPSTNFNTAPAPTAGSTINQILEQRWALERAEHYGRRYGRAEAVLGGAILGGFFEHIRHKSRERKMERQAKQLHQKQEKRLNDLEFQHNLLKTDQLELARKQEAARYERKAEAKQEMATIARAQMSEAEAIKRAQEVTHSAQEQEREKAALIERLNAQAAHQEQLEAENMLLNAENHIEESAWHSIEVDKAGHAVQDTNIEYGHEYYQERGHESGPKDVVTRDSVTGAAALTAATMTQSSQGAQQQGSTAPPMVGMPTQSASSTAYEDSTYNSSQNTADGANQSSTSAAAVVVLLIALTVVAVLILILT